MSDKQELQPARDDAVVVRVPGGPPKGVHGVVTNVTLSSLWLGLGSTDASLQGWSEGDEVELTFATDDGPVTVTSAFQKKIGKGQLPMFAVEWPPRGVEPREPGRSGRQRRAHIRVALRCQVEYTVVTQSDHGAAGQVGGGLTHDVSAGGLLFETDAPPDEVPGEGDGLEMVIDFGGDVVTAEAEVVRVVQPDGRAASDEARPRTQIAVRFLSIDQSAQDRIVRHVFSILRQRREVEEPQEGPDRRR
jgi:c-di-GMP-binding flagellar brake protein YcgR